MDIKNLKPLPNGEGSFGKCYIVNDELLYKDFYEKKYKKEKFLGKTNIENETFIFPKKIYTKYNIVQGYTMKYIYSPNLVQLDHNISIIDMINALNQVKKDIDEISEMGIIGCDIDPKNILFKEKFNIIDTDFYSLGTDINNIKQENENLFSYAIFYYTLAGSRSILNNINKIPKLNNLVEEMYPNTIELQIEYLTELKKHISEISNQEIDNLKNIQKIIRRIK